MASLLPIDACFNEQNNTRQLSILLLNANRW
jgi:hypothetical protein